MLQFTGDLTGPYIAVGTIIAPELEQDRKYGRILLLRYKNGQLTIVKEKEVNAVPYQLLPFQGKLLAAIGNKVKYFVTTLFLRQRPMCRLRFISSSSPRIVRSWPMSSNLTRVTSKVCNWKWKTILFSTLIWWIQSPFFVTIHQRTNSRKYVELFTSYCAGHAFILDRLQPSRSVEHCLRILGWWNISLLCRRWESSHMP